MNSPKVKITKLEKKMDKHSDCTIVDRNVRLHDLKQWKMNSKESIPFYFRMGDSGQPGVQR